MTSHISGAGILATAALTAGVTIPIYLNNRINTLEESIDETETKLAKFIKLYSDNNKGLLNEIREDMNKQKRIINDFKTSISEILNTNSDIQKENDIMNKRLDHLIDHFKNKIDPEYEDYQDINNYQYDKEESSHYNNYSRSYNQEESSRYDEDYYDDDDEIFEQMRSLRDKR